MKTAVRLAALSGMVALATVPMPALAGEQPSREALYEITLDIDNDGKVDRAVLVLVGPGRTDFHPLTKERYGLSPDESVDLYLYLATGDEKLDLSRKPAFLRKEIVDTDRTGWVQPLESTDTGSLIVTSVYGWGASKSWGESLTIVHRDGELLVAGYARSWDWNSHTSDGNVETMMGGCDINFLDGKGTVSDGLDESRPIEGKFTPVRLADWSAEKQPEACDF